MYYYVHGIRAINWLEQHRVWICDVRITQKLFLYTIFINMTTFLWILLPLNGSSFDIANFIKFTAFIDFFVRGICKNILFVLLYFWNAFLRANSMNFPSFLFFLPRRLVTFFKFMPRFCILVSGYITVLIVRVFYHNTR